jgi:uncharacterized iron-regulated membrane protein
MIRRYAVIVHRWVGLGLALFLIIEGLTGSLLAFNTELTRLFNPALFVTPPSSVAKPLDLATLADRARTIAPRARLDYFASVRRDQAILRMHGDTDPTTGQPYPIRFKYLVLDPWTGRELGRLTEDFHAPGFLENIMPVMYTVHTNLALGQTGAWILSIVALVWTIDCFVGFYLTLPAGATDFWRRWKTSWLVKWPSSSFRLNFDLHRGSGLWFWALLFIFAWSSSVLVWPGMVVNEWVTERLFRTAPFETIFGDRPPHPAAPRLDWRAAQTIGDQLVTQQAAQHGFAVDHPIGLAYLSGFNLYTYDVLTDRAFPKTKDVVVYFDGDDGSLYAVDELPGYGPGNDIMLWFRALHMAVDPVDSIWYRLVVAITGLVIAMLSATGVYIWWYKRRARSRRRGW